MGRKHTDVLGEITSAAARAYNREAEIAEVTGLSEATVRRRLKDAHGKTLVRNVFNGRWPNDGGGGETDTIAVGEMTSAAARSGGREPEIAAVTGLAEAIVSRRLEEAHGNTLVRNVFESRWPSDDDDVDIDVLGEMTAAAAWSGDREAEIANVTGLDEATVHRRLGEAHGNTLVRNVFERQWPSGDDEGDDDEDVDALGEMTAAAAWAVDGRTANIAHVTGLAEATVRRRLEEAHGNTLVRNVFERQWPSDEGDGYEVDVEMLGEMTAASANDREAAIAEVTGLAEATVRRRLGEAHGNTLVRNVFEEHWPSGDDDGDDEVDGDILGEMTAKAAWNGDREAAIAEVTGLAEATVHRRLGEAHGNTLVRNVFEEHWPSGDDDGDNEMDVELLGEMTATTAWNGDREAKIAEVTGLTEATVHRRLEEAHGNTLVRNLFEERWPSGIEDNDDDKMEVAALGEMTVAAAHAGAREIEIAGVTGLVETTVRRRLGEARGNTLVRNVFGEHWPSGDEEVDADEINVDALGAMTTSAARVGGRAPDIASLTGLNEATVRRRLVEAHGKRLVRNLFEDRWSSEEVEETKTEANEQTTRNGATPRSVSRPRPIQAKSASPKSGETPVVQQRSTQLGTSTTAAPRIPAPLRAAYCADNLALFCGSGISLGHDVHGDFPSWRDLPGRLLDACQKYDSLDDEMIELKRKVFKKRMSLEHMLSELASIRTNLGHRYQSALNDIFRPPNAAPGAAHKAVAKLGVRAVLTTNYEQLLERVSETPSRQLYTWKEASHALGDLKRKSKVLLKVHGTAERYDTVVMSEAEYTDARSDASYQAVLRYLLQDHTFLFVGYGMNDPLDLDRALRYNAEAFKSASQQHYLLLRGPSDDDRDRYEREYNVRVIPYNEHAEVPIFLAQLAATKDRPL